MGSVDVELYQCLGMNVCVVGGGEGDAGIRGKVSKKQK
jgi:hypothetical protein